jgi:hypothetical protein
MEDALNLVWALLTIVLIRCWLRHGSRNGLRRGTQAAALLVAAVILFPVISVTDDLQALQNPAELDCCARRHHAATSPRSIPPATAAALPAPVFAGVSLSFLRSPAPCQVPAPLVENPALASIQNRPPPAA